MTKRVMVVTGGFGELGRVMAAVAAAQPDVRVAVLDRAATAPEGLETAIGSEALIKGGIDLTDYAATKAAFDEIADRLGGINALINIAGGFRWQTLADGDLANWDFLYAINVRTAVNASRAALPYLTASAAGRIVNVGANGGVKAGAGMGPYAASKSGVHRLTESLAEEMKGRVTVNAVLPSIIDTPINRTDMPDADFSSWVQPAELAAIILFLVSDGASAITGALIPVTGRV